MNCGRDLREATEHEEVLPTGPAEEGETLFSIEEEEGEEEPPPVPEAPPEVETPAWMSPASQTLWIVTIVVLLMLLCCCGVLGLVALTRMLGQGPAF
jgi:hypothetical protein